MMSQNSSKLSSLKEIHTELLAEYRDKGEAIELTKKCTSHFVPSYVSSNKWMSRCKAMKLTANLVPQGGTYGLPLPGSGLPMSVSIATQRVSYRKGSMR